MKKVNKKIAVFILLANTLFSFAQMDTAFWFVAPDVTSAHDAASDSMIGFMITTTYAANITITEPANGGFTPINVFIPANTVQWVPLSSVFTIVENQPPNTTLNFGIYIQSDVKVTIYYEKKGFPTKPQYNNAIFNLKGNSALGNRFYIPKQSPWGHANIFGIVFPPKRGFDIVATKNNTTVTITPSQDMVGHTAAGGPFTITLNKGQTYSAIKSPLFAPGGPTNEWDPNHPANQGFLEGTLVTSDSAIAITVFVDSEYFPGSSGKGYDLTGDQIFPVSKTGKEYIGVTGKLHDHNEHILVTATQPGTTSITINGTLVGSITQGQSFDIDSTKFLPYLGDPAFVYIQASQQVYAYQVTGNGKEVSASILPPVDKCSGSNSVGFTRSHLDTAKTGLKFFANILVQNIPAGGDTAFKLYRNGTLVPGAIPASNFVNIALTWKVARVDLTGIINANDAGLLTNDVAYFHLGIFNAAENVSEYGYFSDLNPVDVLAMIKGFDTSLAVVCSGTPLYLWALAANATEYRWSPSTYLSDTTIANPVATFDKTDSIKYMIRARMCSLWDTAYLTVRTVEKVDQPIGDTIKACYGSPIQPIKISNYDSGAILYWFTDAAMTDTVHKAASDSFASGDTAVGKYIYYVTQMHDPHCISLPQLMMLVVDDSLNKRQGIARDVNICSNESIDLYTTLTDYDTAESYWADMMGTGKLSGSIFNPSGIKGGTYQFVHTFDFWGCPVDSAWTNVTTDIYPPEIICKDSINRSIRSIGNTYLVAATDSFGPISVSDNCQYRLSNNINGDSTLILAQIDGSTIITWVAIDSGLNVASCNTVFTLDIIRIPNTISPNGDGANDYFDISFEASYPNAVLEIFDRWGKKIFISQKGYPDKWYGTVNGSLVPVDTYQYIVRDGDHVVQKGFISVVY